MTKKKLLSLLLSGTLLLSISGCSDTAEEIEEEGEEQQTLTIADKAYYKQLEGKNVTLNVYNWGEYICTGEDEGTLNVNAEFSALTGIKVNYSTYATNEELYAKLKGGGASYDIIIPSDYMISRMISEDMLEKLDYSNIPNFSYVMDSFISPAYDPENEYTVPYLWGTIGIIYDETMVDIPKESIDWSILWNEDYADQILMFDNPRDAFAIAELSLGYSLNTTDEKSLIECAELLKSQKPVVQAYVMDEIFDKMGAGDALVAPYYAGDALTIMAENDSLNFVIPDSGTNLFIDAVCIPKCVKNKLAAEMYINFLCEPDIAYANTWYVGYSTPNSGAYEKLDEDIKNDGISYPSDEFLESSCETFENLTDEANLKMQSLWTELKSADDTLTNKWIVPLFMLACVTLTIVVLIIRHFKKKRDIF